MMARRAARALLILAGVAAAPALATASSPTAWDALFARATTECGKASGLAGVRAIGKPVDFEARVLVLLQGRWPQKHMKGKRATFACLYDKKDGKAEAQEAQGLR